MFFLDIKILFYDIFFLWTLDAWSNSVEYLSSSANFCRIEIGSFKKTGRVTLVRSYPMKFLTILKISILYLGSDSTGNFYLFLS